MLLVSSRRFLEASVGRCRPADDGADGRLADQLQQPLERILAVSVLRAVFLGVDDEHAILRHATARDALQSLLDVVGQRRRPQRIEAQLNCGLDLVHILPRPGRMHAQSFSSSSRSSRLMRPVTRIRAGIRWSPGWEIRALTGLHIIGRRQ